MIDDTQSDAAPAESREGKLARRHKTAIGNALDELLEAMNEAHRDGFTTEFSITPSPEGYNLQPGHPVMIKRW